MNPPKVSVLIPTFNYARFLPEAVESVLAQDFPDFELLIVDDCSTDNTAEVVRPFCLRDARVRFTVNPANLGLANNWNGCLDRARGEYIKFLFGDDLLSDPGALRKMIALLQNHASAKLAASARLILDEQSKVTDLWRTLPEGCHDGRKIMAACLVEHGNLIGEPSAALFRKQDAARGFDVKFRQLADLEMWFHLLEKGDLAYTREPLCAFRRHQSQQSALNDASGLTRQEQALFFADYAGQPWLPRQARFSALYALRRLRRKNHGAVGPDLSEAEHRLAGQLGQNWYRLHWLRYKLTNPFHSLHRSIEKRFARRRVLNHPPAGQWLRC